MNGNPKEDAAAEDALKDLRRTSSRLGFVQHIDAAQQGVQLESVEDLEARMKAEDETDV